MLFLQDEPTGVKSPNPLEQLLSFVFPRPNYHRGYTIYIKPPEFLPNSVSKYSWTSFQLLHFKEQNIFPLETLFLTELIKLKCIVFSVKYKFYFWIKDIKSTLFSTLFSVFKKIKTGRAEFKAILDLGMSQFIALHRA